MFFSVPVIFQTNPSFQYFRNVRAEGCWIIFQVETQLELMDVLMSPIPPIITGLYHNPILARLKHHFRPVLCLSSPPLNSHVICVSLHYSNIDTVRVTVLYKIYLQV